MTSTSHTTGTALKASELNIELTTKDLQVDIDTMPAIALTPGGAVDVTDRAPRLLGAVTTDALKAADLEIDPTHNALVTIDLAHHMVHEGEHYTVTDSATINSGAANRKVWRFTTPNTAVRMHFVLSFSSTLSGALTWNENPTLNVAGTGLTIFNSDRNSPNTTTLTAFKDTTLTGDGSPLATVVIGTNAPATRIGGNTRINAETILKQNEDYVLIFTADLNSTVIAMVAEFYEA